MEDQTLTEIRDELRELRILYTRLAQRLIPQTKPTAREEAMIREPGEFITEEELLEAVNKPRKR